MILTRYVWTFGVSVPVGVLTSFASGLTLLLFLLICLVGLFILTIARLPHGESW